MQNPSFDTWTIIFLFSAIQGLFVSLVLWTRNEKNLSRKLLAIIPFIFSLILVEYVLYWTRYSFYYPYLVSLSNSLYLLFGPLFYLYFLSIFENKQFSKRTILHFLPFLICLIYHSPFIFSSIESKQKRMLASTTEPAYVGLLIVWLGIAQLLVYAWVIYKRFYPIAIINKEIKQWFYWLFGFYVAFILSYVSYYILVNFSFFNAELDYAISFTMMFFIFFLSWFGYLQPKVFSGFMLFETLPIKYKSSPLNTELSVGLLEKLNNKMIEHKYYLESDLSLEKLAGYLNISKHYLSQLINEALQLNFFEYINSLRIAEAKLLLDTNKDLTIIEIAYRVGYNNKVSFNKAFKNIVGITPTEYKTKEKGKSL